jgi:hypothetical protein
MTFPEMSVVVTVEKRPHRTQSNILVSVSGRELKDEEMIKLPIRLDVDQNLTPAGAIERLADRVASRACTGLSAKAARPTQSAKVERSRVMPWRA